MKGVESFTEEEKMTVMGCIKALTRSALLSVQLQMEWTKWKNTEGLIAYVDRVAAIILRSRVGDEHTAAREELKAMRTVRHAGVPDIAVRIGARSMSSKSARSTEPMDVDAIEMDKDLSLIHI